MRILQVNRINQVADSYANDLMQYGHDVEVYEPSFIGGFAPLPIKMALMPWRILDLRRVVGKLHQNHFDVIHIHWASYGALGLVSRVPFIVHCHGDDVLVPTFRPLLKPIFRRAAAVICITPDLLPHVRSIRPDAIFLPASVNTDRFRPIEDHRENLTQPWTILLFTCLEPKKGLEISTQGIARFARRHSEVRVRLVDWGSESGKYKRRYSGRFEFVPRVAPQLVQNLIASANVVVGQFLAGAIGFSELQAMSCGKPVIASFRYDDAYPSPPPLFRANSSEEIDEQLEYLFQHPEEGISLGEKSREWVVENHDHRILGRRLESLYKSILG